MENKIVYLKTYITTIGILIAIFLIGIAGCVYYYENKIVTLENKIQTNQSGISIVQNIDTDVNNVTAK